MTLKWHHATKIGTGTAADRAGVDSALLRKGTFFIEDSPASTCIYDGVQWLPWETAAELDTRYLKLSAPGTEVPDHTHTAAQAGQLDWDDVWLDAVHDHTSAAEGGTIIVDSTTRTVKAAGGDFTTIQAAIDWFADKKILYGANYIDVDATAYDEAVDFSGIFCVPGATLTLRGDTRVLVGLTYVDTVADNTDAMNKADLANGGDGICTLSNAGNNITVAGSIANPDFDAAGLVNGDRVLAYDNAGVIALHTIDSVLNNVITLTAAAPALGNDGTAVCLLPNRSIERTVAGPCIQVTGQVKGIVVDGFYLESAAGASCDGIFMYNGPEVTLHNLVTYVEDFGFHVTTGTPALVAQSGDISVWGGSRGVVLSRTAFATLWYLIVVGASAYGYLVSDSSGMSAAYAQAITCVNGFQVQQLSWAYLANGVARQNTNVGYYAGFRGYIQATTADANNNGNAADYSPAVSDAWGNSNGSVTWS